MILLPWKLVASPQPVASVVYGNKVLLLHSGERGALLLEISDSKKDCFTAYNLWQILTKKAGKSPFLVIFF